MNNAISYERWRLLLMLVSIGAIGLLTDNWIVAILLPSALYIMWSFYQLYALERWLRKGAVKKKAPDSGGAWGEIVQHIYRRQLAAAKSKKRLASMLTRFNTTISALPDATVILNASFEIEWANKAAREVLGIDKRRDIGQRIDNLIRNPDFHRLLNKKRNKKQKNLEMPSPLNPTDTISVRLVRYGKGSDQYLLLARDISERIEAQKTRKAFIANASHELRTPLTVISGYLEIMQSAPELCEEMQEPVRAAAEQAHRMEQIITHLLELSRLESAELAESDGERVDVPAILNNISSTFSLAGDDGSHMINLDVDPALHLLAKEEEMHSVCLNLINNAVKYTPPGSTIDIRWYQNSVGQACLDVEDDGYGIAPEHLAHVTERFYRVDEGRNSEAGGTGLGLAIVKHILTRHGGHLWVDSTLGEGATFRACFPKSRVLS
ncbi:MAG: phosphate regulon sensor histidine kinase PhoR [Gammaproteobacteria bacterium]|nr:phosphate regulon sensor histidine kinase PhoR [Gammaproteobacteria bacterium]